MGSLRLDPLTERILALVDGVRSASEIASTLGAGREEVADRLRALGQARVVSLTSKLVTDDPISRPPQSPGLVEVPREGFLGGRKGIPAKGKIGGDEPWSGVERGSLAGRSGKEVLDEAGRSSFTGAVKLEMGEDRVVVYFEQGTPTGVESNAARHEYGRMLLNAGHFDAARFERYTSAMERGAKNPLAAMRQAGVEGKAELARLVVWCGGSILSEVGAWSEGAYTLSPGASVPAKIPRCRLKALHRPKIRWRDAELTEAQLDLLANNANRYLVPGADASGVVASMSLDPKEARFVEHVLSAPIQLRRAMTISTLLRGITRKILFRLIDNAAVEIHETNPDGEGEVSLADLELYCRSLERDNDFNVLAIHPTSSEDDIRERYEKRLARFADERYPGADNGHRESLRRIRDRIERAWEALRDPVRRREYVQAVYSEDQITSFFDLQLRKAEIALKMRQRADEALDLAASALQLRPASQEARLVLAGAQAALGKTAKARATLRNVKAVPARLQQDLDQLRRSLGA